MSEKYQRRTFAHPLGASETIVVFSSTGAAGGAEIPLVSSKDDLGGNYKLVRACQRPYKVCLYLIRNAEVRYRPFPPCADEDPRGGIHVGIQSLATIQRIGRGCRCPEHCFARLDLFPSFTAIEDCNGYGFQRWCSRVLRPTI